MRKAYKYILSALVVVLLGAAAMSFYFYGKIEHDYSEAQIKGVQSLKYHFSIIINNNSSLYWQEFMNGARDAAKKYETALELHEISSIDDIDEARKFMRIAVSAKNDGIIINTLDNVTYVDDIKYATGSGVPVLTTGTVPEESQKISYYVGTSAYEYGLSAARLAVESAGSTPKIALIVDESISIGNMSDAEGLEQSLDTEAWIVGFLEGISVNKGAEILVIKKTSSSVIGAEDVVQSIFDEYPDVNAIFCMTPEDTVAAAQAIIDRNKVGAVVVTGTDLSLTPPVLKYINKNIIYGYITRNPYDAGYRCVEALFRVVSGEFQATYVDIDLDIITKENIDEYITKDSDG